jgi:integrase
MAKKRRFGRVRKLPSGRWQARYPGPDGIDRPAPYTFDTKTDAEIWLSEKEIELRRTVWIDPDAGRILVKDYFDKWLKERKLSPRTRELYRDDLYKLYLGPAFGEKAMADVTLPMVRSWRMELLNSGAPELQVAKAYRLLRAVMNTAVNEDEIIARNPCRIRGAGQEFSPERPMLDIAVILKIAEAIQPRYRLTVLLAAFTQLRYGELMALRRRDVDMASGVLRVKASVTQVRRVRTLKGPKSPAGYRRVAIPAVLWPDVQHHIKSFAEAGPEGRVFVGPKGATPTTQNFNRIWKRALKTVGLPDKSPDAPHFHDLRHAGGTLVAETGATTKELMRRVGHSSTRAAMIYQHGSDRRDRVIAEGLSAMIDKARSGT